MLSCFVTVRTRSFTVSLVSSTSSPFTTSTSKSSVSVDRVVALSGSDSFSIISENTPAVVSPCCAAFSLSTLIRSSSVVSSMPSDTSVVPSVSSTSFATSPAISCSRSRSRPLIIMLMPLPPRALISMLEVDTSISASMSSVSFRISFFSS